MRIALLLLCVLLAGACSSGSGVTDSGSGGSDGGGGKDAGSDAGPGEPPTVVCTPEGFPTALEEVNLLPIPGVSYVEVRAHGQLDANDGGRSTSVTITVEDSSPTHTVPAVTASVNGCTLTMEKPVPGVGKELSATGTAVWDPTAGRFLVFEVLSPSGALLYRKVLAMPAVLPRIVAVANPGGPNAQVDWTPILDAGVSASIVDAYAASLQRVGGASVSVSDGTVTFPVSQAGKVFTLDVQLGLLSGIRLVSTYEAP